MNLAHALAVTCCISANMLSSAQPGTAESPELLQERLQELLDQVPLPEAYYIESDLIGSGPLQNGQTVSRFKTWIGSDWSVSLQSMVQPGIGDVPTAYIYAGPSETWHYYLDRRQAERTGVFAQRSFTSSESLTSVSYILRALRRSEARILDIAHDAEGGNVAVSLSQPGLYLRATLTFDTHTHFLTRVQAYDQPGKNLQLDEHYKDWRFFSDGSAIPFELNSERFVRGERIQWRSLVTRAELLDDENPPERIPVSPAFTIIDRIEGVTKRADGTVLGPIENGAAPASAVRTTPPGSGLSARTFMLIGVGLILLAGIVLGIRRWRGA